MKTTISDPPKNWEEVTLSDTANIAMGVCHCFIPNQDCDLKVTTAEDQETTFYGLLGGIQYSARIKRFWSTGTTASTKITAGR